MLPLTRLYLLSWSATTGAGVQPVQAMTRRRGSRAASAEFCALWSTIVGHVRVVSACRHFAVVTDGSSLSWRRGAPRRQAPGTATTPCGSIAFRLLLSGLPVYLNALRRVTRQRFPPEHGSRSASTLILRRCSARSRIESGAAHPTPFKSEVPASRKDDSSFDVLWRSFPWHGAC